ncbi:MAG: L,D-transpeptidase family protein [Novosphingobium sp.]
MPLGKALSDCDTATKLGKAMTGNVTPTTPALSAMGVTGASYECLPGPLKVFVQLCRSSGIRYQATMRIGAILLALTAFSGGAVHGQPAFPEVAEVRVEKAARRLLLLDAQGYPVKIYDAIQLGDEPVGPKRFEGDERTPEGRYLLDYGNASSAFHLSLHISYPDSRDRAYAESQGKSAGGAIFIHGQPNSLGTGRMEGDWTDGCIALSNEEIEEVWQLVPDGTPVELVP